MRFGGVALSFVTCYHPPMNTLKCQFASDNYAGICPEAFRALEEANRGFERAYGDDTWTERASNKIREIFDTECEVFFVFNGTAANSLALSSLCKSYHSIIAHEMGHIETDECGAPEFFSNGTKILTVKGENGKIDPAEAEHVIMKRSDIHYPKPKVLSITEPTEVGTLYSVEELKRIQAVARKHSLRIHMDGARFANAIAAMNVHPSEITWRVGVDVLCFGGTKNGLAVGDAVVFFDKELAYEFDYRCKQAGQLASKMRFMSGPWITMLESGAWLKHAAHANDMARKLEAELKKLPAVTVMFPREVNSVFVSMSADIAAALRNKGWYFYDFIGTAYTRFMCSWATSEKDILGLVSDIKEVSGGR